MDTGEEDASLGEHFVQSLSREIPHYQHQSSEVVMPNEQESLRMAAGPSTQQSASSLQHLYQPNIVVGQHTLSGTNQTSTPVPQNLTKSSINYQDFSSSNVTSALSQKIALLPVGNSGTEFLPVRIGNLAANLPLLAAKLASSGTGSPVNSSSNQLVSVVLPADDTAHIKTRLASRKSKLLLVSSDGQTNQQTLTYSSTSSSIPQGQNLPRPSFLDNSTDSSGLNYYANATLSYNTSRSEVMQPLASPVYKSKLEKAMAQNLLMQNTAKENRTNKTSIAAEHSDNITQTKILQETVPLSRHGMQPVVPESEPVSQSVPSQQLQPSQLTVNSQFSSPISIPFRPKQPKKEAVIIPRYEQDVLSVTKVAERYRDMVTRQTMESHQTSVENLYLQQQLAEQTPISQFDNFDSSQYPSTPRSQDSNFAYSEMTNQHAPFAYLTPSTCYSQPMEMENHSALVTEKVYKDSSLGSTILKYLWQLRQDEKFCDAIIFTGTDPVKLHKIVLIAASPEIQKKLSDVSDPEMKLVVPEGITTTNILTFIYYIYMGEIRLTVDNVQQIYRLSCIFGVEELGKYCYNFCKEAKIGHLIIASPYQEAARHIDKQFDKKIPTVKENASKSTVGQSVEKNRSVPSTASSEPLEDHVSVSTTPVKSVLSPRIEQKPVTMVTVPTSSLNDLSEKQPKNPPVPITQIREETVQRATNLKKSMEKEDTMASEKKIAESLDIDWMTNDPSQSNIPIRKRGRNRKAISSSISNVAKVTKDPQKVVTKYSPSDRLNSETKLQDSVQDRGGNTIDIQPEEDTVNVTTLSVVTASLNDPDGEINMKVVATGSKSNDPVASFKGKRKGAGLRGRKGKLYISEQVEKSLPDPLMSGKLDENELMKLEHVSDNGYSTDKMVEANTSSKEGRVGMSVTRFRRRPVNMSVLEVASQKKAKSNDTSALFTSPVLTRSKQRGKRHVTSAKPPLVYARTGSDPGIKLTSTENNNSEISKAEMQKNRYIATKDNESKDIMSSVDSTNNKDVKNATHREAVHLKSKIMEVRSLTTMGNESVAVETDQEGGRGIERRDKDTFVPSPPKKARFRKSALDQLDIKDKVYMRPPPKKRTKEIREMMKNEEDDKITAAGDHGATLSNQPVMDYPRDLEIDIDVKENVVKKAFQRDVRKKMRKPRVKNEALLSKVAELDMTGSKIYGTKLYRCCFCDSEFLFAKRALSHVVSTHEITVDECVQYVTVENKNSPTKDIRVCDICGYKTKECGIYYIHFHKYFRHGVPLPKGWSPFTCDLCKKEFFTKFQLREHKLIHFEDNPFVCDTCGNGFKSRTCLNSHVFHKHNKEKRYKCPECPKTFKTRTQIKVHSRIHSGEKPFLCPMPDCTYRSTTRGNMKLHLCSKHKIETNVVKSMMEQLTVSEPGTEKEQEAYMTGTPDTVSGNVKSSRKNDVIHNEAAPLEILVLSDVNENVNLSGNEGFITGNAGQGLNISNNIVDEFEMSSQDKTQNIADMRDFGQLVQNTSAGDNTQHRELETQNIPRHVQMLIHDVNNYQQHHTTGDDSSQMINNLRQTGMNIPNSVSSTYVRGATQGQSQLNIQHHYDQHDSEISRFASTVAPTEMPKIMDPHSREARMIIKEAFENQSHRKSSLLHGAGFGQRLPVEQRSSQDASQSVPESSLNFQEADNLVIDLQESSSHHDDPVVVSLRNQIQQLRGSSHQYRDGSDTELLRSDHNVQELLQNIASSQHQQSIDPGHFQVYHQRQSPPPAYQSTSHGLVSIPDLEPRQSVTLNAVDTSEGQGQMAQDPTMIQGQGYSNIAPHSSAPGQYGTDNNLYPGYYEEQYDIENY